VVSKVAEQEADVEFYYMDVDQTADIAEIYQVKSIPTLVLIKDGEEANRSIGFIPEDQVKDFAHS
jgi:thioredoxin 1